MSLLDRIRRANPVIDSATYRVLKGEITETEYRLLMDKSRVRHELPPIHPDADAMSHRRFPITDRAHPDTRRVS